MPAPQHRETARRARARAALLTAVTLSLTAAAGLFAPTATAASDPAVTLASPTTATAGDVISVTIAADAVSDLYAYELTLQFDPALLAYDDGSAVFPAGGYDAATPTSGQVTITHTRLGSSPGLTGPQSLVTLAFTVLAGGQTTALTPTAITFVASDGASTAVTPPAAAVIALDAAPVVEPGTPDPETSVSPSATPVVADSGDTSSDPLASTGADAAPFLVGGALAAAVIALGIVLIVRRATTTKESLR